MRVGVLALQGGVAPHLERLAALGHEARAVRRAAQIERLDGLVLPGGESTAQLHLLADDLARAVDRHVASGRPVLATCAGVIVAARRGWLDVDVIRNAYGRQQRSAEAEAEDGTPLVLIRAPRILRTGPGVEVRLRFGGAPVLVQQGAVVGATFHPELTSSLRVHAETFADTGSGARGGGGEPRGSGAVRDAHPPRGLR
ncbi:MAG: pyridoxal 5'-phosphate synthase glutaminase subunit PdxT [Sandaracinaceae bacterium]